MPDNGYMVSRASVAAKIWRRNAHQALNHCRRSRPLATIRKPRVVANRLEVLRLFAGPWRFLVLFLLIGEAILTYLAIHVTHERSQIILIVGTIACVAVPVISASWITLRSSPIGADIEKLQLSGNDYRLLFAVDEKPSWPMSEYESAIVQPASDVALRSRKASGKAEPCQGPLGRGIEGDLYHLKRARSGRHH